MADTIKLNTGLKTFKIEFTDRGEVAEISFNPTDKGLLIRFKEAQKRIGDRLKPFEDVELEADGMPKNSDFVDEFEKMTNIIYEEIDRAFDSKICETVFKYCNPFSAVNGNYFYLTFFEAIAPVIKKCGSIQSSKANANMNKYLQKYGKCIKK